MTFDAINVAAARSIFNSLGVGASYQGGDVTVILDRDVDPFPDGFDSVVSEKRHTISALLSEIPTPVRGQTITIGAEVWTIQDIIANDGIEIAVTVK